MLVEGQFCRDNISGTECSSSVLDVWEMRPASAVTLKQYMRSLLGIVRLCIGSFDGVATKEVPWIMSATASMLTVTIHFSVSVRPLRACVVIRRLR